MDKTSRSVVLSGTGCCLVDEIFNNIDFKGTAVSKYRSMKPGDGGLTPGQLVFSEEFEHFSGKDFHAALRIFTGGRPPDVTNVGGPSIVALIHAAQMLAGGPHTVRFTGVIGKDQEGRFLAENLSKIPIEIYPWKYSEKRTASTVVLSDPGYDQGHGERMFINTIGAAWDLQPGDLSETFFDADIIVFGGTALVPNMHDNLPALLQKSRSGGAVTVVNTVYDFRNQKADPTGRWPLGDDSSFPLIDLLITDHEEALRLSGSSELKGAINFFQEKGVSSFIITNGSKDLTAWSDGRLFGRRDVFAMPVSAAIVKELRSHKTGDTTGCGDNFVGGVLASMVRQLEVGSEQLDLQEGCSWGIVSGGFACFYMGGTYYENSKGEKLGKMMPYLEAYKQIQLDE